MREDVAGAFSRARVPLGGRMDEILPAVSELTLHSPEWNAFYDLILCNHAEHLGDARRVLGRLSAELDFFRTLYRPGGRFSIHPVDEHDFGHDEVIPTILFESGGIVYGRADFSSWPEAIVMDYIQSATRSSSREQIEAFGSRWFEAFMDRAVEACAAIRGRGVGLMLRIGENSFLLPRMVRDRYFEARPGASLPFLPLAKGKARVKRILRQGCPREGACSTR
jgi:hypothetical protein